MNLDDVKIICDDYSKIFLQHYKPKYIVLYGSYAYGTAKEESDFDLAFIFDDKPDNWYDILVWLYLLLENPYYRKIQPIIVSINNDKSGFTEHILSTGIKLYS
ncbi:MAG: nucleotidyltransferase domain-containing protein [Deltaproteobacteria bacterium]|jgi:predicted nucleotidyltransferase|nr:nucleotidyltransferase domain-containing protein [Deltaproteobacteria bacterium]